MREKPSDVRDKQCFPAKEKAAQAFHLFLTRKENGYGGMEIDQGF